MFYISTNFVYVLEKSSKMIQHSSKLLQSICRRIAFPKQVRCYSLTEKDTTAVNEPTGEEISVNNNEDMIITERYGPVTIIQLNRTHKRNAINQEMAFKVCEAITKFENDDTSPVGVIHGLGGSFCAGYDIDELQSETLKLENLMNSEGSVVSGSFIEYSKDFSVK